MEYGFNGAESMSSIDDKPKEGALKSSRMILDEEVREAEMELERPASCLFVAGLMGGLGIGVSHFLMGIALTLTDGTIGEPTTAFLLANAHAAGFIIVIMGRTDLFTEYTTLAILPVLEGRASVVGLARFWGWIYSANLIGAAVFALMTSVLGPSLGVVEAGGLTSYAHELIGHTGWTMLLSAVLAGWLMGLLAWLVVSGRDTISQVFFIWLIAFVIGLAHLHHSISGFVVVFFAWMEGAFGGAEVGRFVLWVTLGNTLGGMVFAVLTRFRASLRTM